MIILFIHLFTKTGSCDQDPVIPGFPIHDFSECVNGILILVMIHESNHDSTNFNVIPSGFHELPEFSLRDPLYVFNLFVFRIILCHNIRRVFFAPNILNLNVFIIYHVPQIW